MQIQREIFKEPTRKGKSPEHVLVKAKTATALSNTTATQHESRVQSTHLINPKQHAVIATGIISNIIYITELQNKPNVAFHSLKGFSGLFALNT